MYGSSVEDGTNNRLSRTFYKNYAAWSLPLVGQSTLEYAPWLINFFFSTYLISYFLLTKLFYQDVFFYRLWDNLNRIVTVVRESFSGNKCSFELGVRFVLILNWEKPIYGHVKCRIKAGHQGYRKCSLKSFKNIRKFQQVT